MHTAGLLHACKRWQPHPAYYRHFTFCLRLKGSGADFLVWYHRQPILLPSHTRPACVGCLTLLLWFLLLINHWRRRIDKYRPTAQRDWWKKEMKVKKKKSGCIFTLEQSWQEMNAFWLLTLTGMVICGRWWIQVSETAPMLCVVNSVADWLTVVRWGAKCCSDEQHPHHFLSLSLSHSLSFSPPTVVIFPSTYESDSVVVVSIQYPCPCETNVGKTLSTLSCRIPVIKMWRVTFYFVLVLYFLLSWNILDMPLLMTML